MRVPPKPDPDPADREARFAADLAARGEMAAACDHYERAVRLRPENPQFHYRLATCEWRLGRPRAGDHLRRAVELDPSFPVAFAALAAWSLQQGQVAAADDASRTALYLAPDDPAVLQSRASVLEAVGELDAAWDLADRLVTAGFVSMPVIRLYGRMARYRGRQQAALDLIEQRLAGGGLSATDAARLRFTAADLLDSLGRYDDAFGHARQGNELARPSYNPAAHERTFDAFIEFFTRDRGRSLPRGSDRSDKPVFIVGMPRSGTSLVEQILASHPAVHGAGELELMSAVCLEAVRLVAGGPHDYPASLARLTAEQADRLARSYLQPLTDLAPEAARITDKLPLNFLHLGLIAVLLPGARVIDCRRDPWDICLSCYMTMFEAGNDFKYDLNHTAHFYNQYRRLMRHWRQAVDLPILDVAYEELVTDPENQTQRMLNFLGLPWDNRCLSFFENKRPVLSSSVEQIRRPLYSTSIGRWRRYRSHLAELDKWFGEPPAETA